MPSDAGDRIRILMVDDDERRLHGLRDTLEPIAEVIIRHPLDVVADDLLGVDLVSVDEYLGPEWADAVSTGALSKPASIKNSDGLSVAASFRSQTRQSTDPARLDFAVTLHTGELNKLAEGLPQEKREPLTAIQHDLDWVFAFEQLDLGSRLVSLALGVRSASNSSHLTGLQDDFGVSWLAMPKRTWATTAREQIEDCRPPAHGLALNTNGRSYLRWLAQRILPYPTFLLDRSHSANLLGVTEASFQELEASLGVELDANYAGPLSHFMGGRWWRAAWQQLVVDSGANPWDSAPDKASALSAHTGIDLIPLSSAQPVVAYSAQGAILDIDADSDLCVRLQADGWPIYADDPWARVSDALEDPHLARLVILADRVRIAEAQ